MTKEELLKSRERKILIPKYDPYIENRFFNGIDLNNNKNTDFIYGDLKVKIPNWKELKVAYKKTIWFGKSKEDKRDIYLRSIL